MIHFHYGAEVLKGCKQSGRNDVPRSFYREDVNCPRCLNALEQLDRAEMGKTAASETGSNARE